MKYYRVLALFALLASTLLCACGGGSNGFSLGSPAITPDQSPYVTVMGASGLKPELHFTYSLSGHPSANGFTVVAVDPIDRPARGRPMSRPYDHDAAYAMRWY